MKLSPEYMKRTEQAMEETQRLLAKEQSYRADLQNADMISFYERHISKLAKMLETGMMAA